MDKACRDTLPFGGFLKWGIAKMENPLDMDDLGVPLFQNISISPKIVQISTSCPHLDRTSPFPLALSGNLWDFAGVMILGVASWSTAFFAGKSLVKVDTCSILKLQKNRNFRWSSRFLILNSLIHCLYTCVSLQQTTMWRGCSIVTFVAGGG